MLLEDPSRAVATRTLERDGMPYQTRCECKDTKPDREIRTPGRQGVAQVPFPCAWHSQASQG
eukprot:6062069-Alexandrium_andersonii.AAC.1